MSYTYDYPHPAVTTDIVVFSVRQGRFDVLLIERLLEPFKGRWALPGGFVQIDESLEDCAMRELAEETGVTDIYLEQLYTFGAPARDPRERVISVAYFALEPASELSPRAGSDARRARWFPVDDLPELAFDHDLIVETARTRLAAKLEYSAIAMKLLPAEFTLAEVQALYEVISGRPRDKRNFRKWLTGLGFIEETGEKRTTGAHRPAKLYRIRRGTDLTQFV
jgi:8-oxo-dGTP diphosphatase